MTVSRYFLTMVPATAAVNANAPVSHAGRRAMGSAFVRLAAMLSAR